MTIPERTEKPRPRAEKRQKSDDFVATFGPFIIGGIFAAAVMGSYAILTQKDYNANNKPLPKDVDSAQKQLSTALKDRAVTDRIIEQVKDPSVIQEFMADPEIMENLRRLANAIEGDAKRHPTNWTGKAVQDKNAQSTKRK